MTLSDALSTCLSQLSCSFPRIERFSSSALSSSALKCEIESRMILMYFLGAYTGVAGTQNATSTPAIVGWMPELRKRNQITPPHAEIENLALYAQNEAYQVFFLQFFLYFCIFLDISPLNIFSASLSLKPSIIFSYYHYMISLSI